MALAIYFPAPSFTKDQYDEVVRRLDAAGAGSPPGRSYHCAFDAGPNVHVFDVWESQEEFDKFGETLMPIMGELGANPGEPQIAQVHNIIVG
ncbi:MAG: hypothetical protein JWL67_1848 [Solirubrobacterales bacterium]|jgi:hypothetical protein|nr:hypothetical protein [Solirubrobacterales bacterium]